MFNIFMVKKYYTDNFHLKLVDDYSKLLRIILTPISKETIYVKVFAF